MLTLDQRFKVLESAPVCAMESSRQLCFEDATALYARGCDPEALRRLERAADYAWGSWRPDGWYEPVEADIRTVAAVKLLIDWTDGRCDVWALAGPGNAKRRQALMLALTGDKLPQAQCGVNALRTAFYARVPVDGDYIAQAEEAFRRSCRRIAATYSGQPRQEELHAH